MPLWLIGAGAILLSAAGLLTVMLALPGPGGHVPAEIPAETPRRAELLPTRTEAAKVAPETPAVVTPVDQAASLAAIETAATPAEPGDPEYTAAITGMDAEAERLFGAEAPELEPNEEAPPSVPITVAEAEASAPEPGPASWPEPLRTHPLPIEEPELLALAPPETGQAEPLSPEPEPIADAGVSGPAILVKRRQSATPPLPTRNVYVKKAPPEPARQVKKPPREPVREVKKAAPEPAQEAKRHSPEPVKTEPQVESRERAAESTVAPSAARPMALGPFFKPAPPARSSVSRKAASNSYGGTVRAAIGRHRPRIAGGGRSATVAFGVGPGGYLRFVRVMRSSGNAQLDRAAAASVRSAAPFPRPPSGLTAGDLTYSIQIYFR